MWRVCCEKGRGGSSRPIRAIIYMSLDRGVYFRILYPGIVSPSILMLLSLFFFNVYVFCSKVTELKPFVCFREQYNRFRHQRRHPSCGLPPQK